jgi:hypothetical protein
MRVALSLHPLYATPSACGGAFMRWLCVSGSVLVALAVWSRGASAEDKELTFANATMVCVLETTAFQLTQGKPAEMAFQAAGEVCFSLGSTADQALLERVRRLAGPAIRMTDIPLKDRKNNLELRRSELLPVVRTLIQACISNPYGAVDTPFAVDTQDCLARISRAFK